MLVRLRERGDTLIEVLFAVSIFSAVVVGTIVIMNQGIASAQQALEINLVRNQIDTQAELLRHLNNAKLTALGRNATGDSAEWDGIVAKAGTTAADYGLISVFECTSDIDNCAPDAAGADATRPCEPASLPNNAFFINPKTGAMVEKNDLVGGGSAFRPAVVFSQVQSTEKYTAQTVGEVTSVVESSNPDMVSTMLWIQPVSSANDPNGGTLGGSALTLTKYYDFHIRACWDSPASGGGLMKLGTIVRLYVPCEGVCS